MIHPLFFLYNVLWVSIKVFILKAFIIKILCIIVWNFFVLFRGSSFFIKLTVFEMLIICMSFEIINLYVSATLECYLFFLLHHSFYID